MKVLVIFAALALVLASPLGVFQTTADDPPCPGAPSPENFVWLGDRCSTVYERLLFGGVHSCPDPLITENDPVLLIHGGGFSSRETWRWNYESGLSNGLGVPSGNERDVCRVNLPTSEMGGYRAIYDIQKQAEYVVYAIRTMSARAQRKVDIVAFETGALATRWALRWWPSLQTNVVDDLILLATPNHGSWLTGLFGNSVGCFDSCLQMKPNSQFISLLNSVDETPGDVSYTNIWSATDEFFLPVQAVQSPDLAGATNIRIQDLCAGRPVEHWEHVTDAPIYALAVDALENAGTADISRFNSLNCAMATHPGVDLMLMALEVLNTAAVERNIPFVALKTTEPGPACYTNNSC